MLFFLNFLNFFRKILRYNTLNTLKALILFNPASYISNYSRMVDIDHSSDFFEHIKFSQILSFVNIQLNLLNCVFLSFQFMDYMINLSKSTLPDLSLNLKSIDKLVVLIMNFALSDCSSGILSIYTILFYNVMELIFDSLEHTLRNRIRKGQKLLNVPHTVIPLSSSLIFHYFIGRILIWRN